MRKNGLNSSQGLVAKYEKGEIGGPDPKILRVLAKIYAVDYTEMVLQLVEEKYTLSGKQWDAIKKSIPQNECSFCKLVQESIGTLVATHKH